MAQQVYELNNNGVYGLKNGVYADSLLTIVDDFEDSDTAEYTGDTGNFATQTTTVSHGSVAVEGTATAGTAVSIISTTGLNAYPAQGDTFRCDGRLTDTDDQINILFGVQDSSNWYQLVANAQSDAAVLYKKSSGSYTKLATTSITFSNDLNEFLTIEGDWATDGTITGTFYDSTGSKLGSVSATDTTFASGGVGIRIYNPNVGPTIQADYYRII